MFNLGFKKRQRTPSQEADWQSLEFLEFSTTELLQAKMKILSIRVFSSRYKRGKVCVDGSLEFEN
jgi:hypothetical protein